MKPAISVIIPALNEAQTLPGTLAALEGNTVPREVILVDGGSTDGTHSLAKKAGARVVKAPRPGRAAQMNLGAAEARAKIVFFLHADTRLPPGGLDRVVEIMKSQPNLGGGAFLRRFESPSPLLWMTARLADLRARHLGLFLGDQAIFARRKVLKHLGGFDESLPDCEDLDFSRRLHRESPTAVLEPPAISSARRFDRRGALVTTVSDCVRALRYYRGR